MRLIQVPGCCRPRKCFVAAADDFLIRTKRVKSSRESVDSLTVSSLECKRLEQKQVVVCGSPSGLLETRRTNCQSEMSSNSKKKRISQRRSRTSAANETRWHATSYTIWDLVILTSVRMQYIRLRYLARVSLLSAEMRAESMFGRRRKLTQQKVINHLLPRLSRKHTQDRALIG